MAILPAHRDYTARDFEALSDRLFALLGSVFPDWTDTQKTNFGNLLIEMFCFVGDVLSFNVDSALAESRVATATLRESLLALAKLKGYRPASATAATVDLVLSLDAPMPSDVIIRAGTKASTASTQNVVRFQLLEEVRIPAGALSVTTSAEHSTTHEDIVVAKGVPDQEIVLERAPYLDGSAVVDAENGAYVEVEDFLRSDPLDRHYTVTVDARDRAHIRFGTGLAGTLPTGSIRVRYRVGGGEAGRVEANTVRRLEGVFADERGTLAQVKVNNPARSTGGAPRATNEQIRLRAPAANRSPRTSVIEQDFIDHAEDVPDVARAMLLTADIDPAVDDNTGVLYVVPRGGGQPSKALLQRVYTAVTATYPSLLTFELEVVGPIYLPVNVWAVVHSVDRRPSLAGLQRLGTMIRAALAGYFRIENADGSPNTRINFGAGLVVRPAPTEAGFRDDLTRIPGELPLSDLYNVVRDVPEVRKIDPGPTGFLLNGKHADVTLRMQEFPVLGTVTLIDGESGREF